MFKQFQKFTLMLASVCLLSACAANGPGESASSCRVLGPKTAIGIAGGAVAGAGLMAATANHNSGQAALIGALVGGIVGGLAGKAMDASDCREAQIALQEMQKAKTGKAIVWNNPKTGHKGTLKATGKITKTAQGMCRPITTSMTTENGTSSAQGLTCRDKNGDWYVAS